jgi:hypothetical protein
MSKRLSVPTAAVSVLAFLLTLSGEALGQGRSLPSTTDFMNILALCGAGSGLKLEADVEGSISSLYEKEKTQGAATQDIIAKILELIPPEQRLAAYNAYLDCVGKRLGERSGPEQRGSFDVSGTWRDQWGIDYRMVQEGENFRFSAAGPACYGRHFDAFGRGTIREGQVQSNYQSTLPSYGECSGTISVDGTQINSTCIDSVCGRNTYVAVLLRR